MADASDLDPQTHEVRLAGGERTMVWRRDEIVLRPQQPWSADVMRFLAHLEHCGFDGSPRVEGTGFASDGREAVRFIKGRSGTSWLVVR